MPPPLFCKPFHDYEPLKMVYETGPVCIRSLDLSNDLLLIHEWVNHPKSKEFWQLDESIEKIEHIYTKILEDVNAHSFILTYNNEPVAQVDVYRVIADEIEEHVPGATPDDCGTHLLMAPSSTRIKNLSSNVLIAFLQFYFCFPEAERAIWGTRHKKYKGNTTYPKNGVRILTRNSYDL